MRDGGERPEGEADMTNPTAGVRLPTHQGGRDRHWLILVRPKQPTFGSLVLVCKESVEAFSELSPAAFADLKTATEGIERLLGKVVATRRSTT
jgi:diadenosine tetraphosphate (Ap4A) HIT family hydrolase